MFPIFEVQKTLNKESQETIQNELTTDTNFYYQEWMLHNHFVKSKTLHTTLKEFSQIVSAKNMYRPFFDVNEETKTVTVPNLFVHLIGLPKKSYLYWNWIEDLIKQKGVFFSKDPALFLSEKKEAAETKVSLLGIQKISENDSIKDAFLNVEFKKEDISQMLRTAFSGIETKEAVKLLMKSDSWTYGDLPQQTQEILSQKIMGYIQYYEQSLIFGEPDLNPVGIFEILLHLPKKVIPLIVNFDFPMESPKLLLFNDKGNYQLSFENSVVLTFLNQLGFDIVIIDPNGSMQVEQILSKGVLAVHRIGTTQADISFKEGYGMMERFLSLWDKLRGEDNWI